MSESQQNLPDCFSCGNCSYRTAGYKPLCPQCGQAKMVPMEATATGRIVDFVPVLYPPENLKHLGPYTSVLVRLDNGCNMFGIVRESPARIEIGQSVVISKFDAVSRELFFQTA